jgi:hypothetical protein
MKGYFIRGHCMSGEISLFYCENFLKILFLRILLRGVRTRKILLLTIALAIIDIPLKLMNLYNLVGVNENEANSSRDDNGPFKAHKKKHSVKELKSYPLSGTVEICRF